MMLERRLWHLFQNRPSLIVNSMMDIIFLIHELNVDKFIVVYQQVKQKLMEIHYFYILHELYVIVKKYLVLPKIKIQKKIM